MHIYIHIRRQKSYNKNLNPAIHFEIETKIKEDQKTRAQIEDRQGRNL